jgi:hypothetical protein
MMHALLPTFSTDDILQALDSGCEAQEFCAHNVIDAAGDAILETVQDAWYAGANVAHQEHGEHDLGWQYNDPTYLVMWLVTLAETGTYRFA